MFVKQIKAKRARLTYSLNHDFITMGGTSRSSSSRSNMSLSIGATFASITTDGLTIGASKASKMALSASIATVWRLVLLQARIEAPARKMNHCKLHCIQKKNYMHNEMEKFQKKNILKM